MLLLTASSIMHFSKMRMIFMIFLRYVYFLLTASLIIIFTGCHPQTKPRACESQLSKNMCAKIGQMLIVGFGGYSQDDKTGNVIWDDTHNIIFSDKSNIAKDIKKHVGGVILFATPNRDSITGKFIRDTNIQNPQQLKKLIADLQAYAVKVQKPNELPLLIAIDQEGGMVDRLPSSMGFHQNFAMLTPQALGANEELALSNPDKRSKALNETYQYALQMADEMAGYGINMTFSPVVDVNINPLNPIIGGKSRSFSANPEVVIDQATQFIQAFQKKGIIPVLKHFPGHGSSTGDSHEGLVDVTNTYDITKELEPYRALIQKGYDSPIMTTHVINGQIDKDQCKNGSPTDPATWCPGTLSAKTLRGKLRDELGFKGVIISDDLTMGAISQYYAPLDFEQALPLILEKAINAGVDMFIIANHNNDYTNQVIDTIGQLVKDNKIKFSQIEDANKRIITLKQKIRR